jgi:hypothetical protein
LSTGSIEVGSAKPLGDGAGVETRKATSQATARSKTWKSVELARARRSRQGAPKIERLSGSSLVGRGIDSAIQELRVRFGRETGCVRAT